MRYGMQAAIAVSMLLGLAACGGGAAAVDPLAVASVAIENGSTAYAYRAAFLPPGGYTVAFTCSDDDAAADDVLTFLTPQDATVQPNLISVVDFTEPAPAP